MPSRSAVAEMTRTEVLRHLRDANADYRDCANETALREMLVTVTASLASVTSTSTTTGRPRLSSEQQSAVAAMSTAAERAGTSTAGTRATGEDGWCHAHILRLSQPQAEALLDGGPNGCFLVRETPWRPGSLSLSVKFDSFDFDSFDTATKHIKIKRDDVSHMYALAPDAETFPSVKQLVEHYGTHSLNRHFPSLNTCLETPVRRTTGTAAVELWFLIRQLDHWEPGLVAIVKAILEVQMPSSTFTHLKDGNGHLDVTTEGRRVTNTHIKRPGPGSKGQFLLGLSHRNLNGWAIMTPGVRCGVRCWHITVHEDGNNHTNGVGIGVIGTTDPSDVERADGEWADRGGDGSNSFWHATAHGWHSHAEHMSAGRHGLTSVEYTSEPTMGTCTVYRAGQCTHPKLRDDWQLEGGWLAGDEAVMRIDCGAGTLTLKHRRHGRAFAIHGLNLGGRGPAQEWHVNVCLGGGAHGGRAESVEVQPLSTNQFDAFLQWVHPPIPHHTWAEEPTTNENK